MQINVLILLLILVLNDHNYSYNCLSIEIQKRQKKKSHLSRIENKTHTWVPLCSFSLSVIYFHQSFLLSSHNAPGAIIEPSLLISPDGPLLCLTPLSTHSLTTLLLLLPPAMQRMDRRPQTSPCLTLTPSLCSSSLFPYFPHHENHLLSSLTYHSTLPLFCFLEGFFVCLFFLVVVVFSPPSWLVHKVWAVLL